MLGWLRGRHLRHHRDRARALDPADLDGTVGVLADALDDGDERERALAVEGLAAVARGRTDGAESDDADPGERSVADDGGGRGERASDDRAPPERAALALVGALPLPADDLEATAVRTLRYVATERDSAVRDRLDGPLSDLVDDWEHNAHRRLCVDAGALLAAGLSLPETRAALWTALDGGPPTVREAAALAYCQAPPETVERPAAVAERLRSVATASDDPVPPERSAARALADDRTVAEAARRLESGTE